MKTSSKNLLNRVLGIFGQNANIAILMSGKGSNACAILENHHRYKNLQFRALVTDNPESLAQHIAGTYNIPYFCIPRLKMSREEHFKKIEIVLLQQNIEGILYAGFMKIAPRSFVEKFPGINIHPADLSIKDEAGIPKYRGMHCIKEAIDAGEKSLASTVHVVDAAVDCGASIAISPSIFVDSPPEVMHEKLKTSCEHTTFPETLEILSQGNIQDRQLPIRFQNFK